MRIAKRRRQENKTDYLKRLKLLKSGVPRVVLRKTNRYIIVQYIVSKQAQDKIIFGINSKDLLKYGWPENAKGSLKSISACYLMGILAGKKIIKEKLKKPIMDFGMNRTVHKSRLYSFVKGIVDAGIDIKYDEKIFPIEDRIQGEYMKNKISFNKIKESLEKN